MIMKDNKLDLNKCLKYSYGPETEINKTAGKFFLSYDLDDLEAKVIYEEFEKLNSKIIKIQGQKLYYKVYTWTPIETINPIPIKVLGGTIEDDSHANVELESISNI